MPKYLTGTLSPRKTLIGLPRIARILHVTRATASMYAAREYFPTERIEGRDYARMSDVLAFKARRERERAPRRQSEQESADDRLPAA